MNPVRTLGPAIAANNFKAIWIYLTAPILGALCGAGTYSAVKLPEEAGDNQPSPTRSFKRWIAPLVEIHLKAKNKLSDYNADHSNKAIDMECIWRMSSLTDINELIWFYSHIKISSKIIHLHPGSRIEQKELLWSIQPHEKRKEHNMNIDICLLLKQFYDQIMVYCIIRIYINNTKEFFIISQIPLDLKNITKILLL